MTYKITVNYNIEAEDEQDVKLSIADEIDRGAFIEAHITIEETDEKPNWDPQNQCII